MFLTRFDSSVFFKACVFVFIQNDLLQMDQFTVLLFLQILSWIIAEFTSAIDHIFQLYIMENFLINAITSLFEDSLMDRFSFVCTED